MKYKTQYAAVVVLATVFLNACASPRPLNPARTIQGRTISKSVLVLDAAFTYKPMFVSHTLLPGRYKPVMEDSKGVYFQAPAKIIIGDILQPRLFDGGIYLPNTGSTAYSYNIGVNGDSAKWQLPSTFRYSLSE